MTDEQRLPERPLEIDIDPADEIEVDPVGAESDGLPPAEREWDAPEVDTIEQGLEVPLDDER